MGADGAVLYARVSSAKQAAGDKTSLEDQSLARRGVAEPLGLTVVAVIPKVQSPSKELERPGFNQACGIIEDGRASWLLVWDVNRIARDHWGLHRLALAHFACPTLRVCDRGGVPKSPDQLDIEGLVGRLDNRSRTDATLRGRKRSLTDGRLPFAGSRITQSRNKTRGAVPSRGRFNPGQRRAPSSGRSRPLPPGWQGRCSRLAGTRG